MTVWKDKMANVCFLQSCNKMLRGQQSGWIDGREGGGQMRLVWRGGECMKERVDELWTVSQPVKGLD